MVGCAHERWEPVEVRDRLDGGTTVVANVCRDCLDKLPAGWGCTDCSWVEVRMLCELRPRLKLGQPCARHAE